MNDNDVLRFVTIHALVVGAWFTISLVRRRGAAELRVRMLEALAAAARHGVPLAPVVERASEERRGAVRAALVRLAENLEGGASLADALTACEPLGLPGATAASIRAAEGTASLGDVLAAAARDQATSRTARTRAWGASLYPLLLLAVLVPLALAVSRSFARLGDVVESCGLGGSGAIGPAWLTASWVPGVSIGVVAILLAGVTLVWVLARARTAFGMPAPRLLPTWSLLGEFPPFRGPSELAGAAAFLGTLAAQVGNGLPLGPAVRTAAETSRNRTVRRGALRLAAAVESGDPLGDAWDEVPLPPSIRPRAVAACRRASRDAAASLERLAEECRARLDVAIEARVRWIAPAGLAVAAFGVGSIAFALFDVQGLVLRSQIPTW